MSTSPTENPGPGVVIFTARGNAALDHLAASLAAECDGSPTSIADLLERVLEADVENLAESLSEASNPPARESRPSRGVEEVGPSAARDGIRRVALVAQLRRGRLTDPARRPGGKPLPAYPQPRTRARRRPGGISETRRMPPDRRSSC